MASVAGSAWAPGSRRTTPLMVTRPAWRSASAPRRDASPACARILLTRMGGRSILPAFALARGRGRVGGAFRNHEITLHFRQAGPVPQAGSEQELARRLV